MPGNGPGSENTRPARTSRNEPGEARPFAQGPARGARGCPTKKIGGLHAKFFEHWRTLSVPSEGRPARSSCESYRPRALRARLTPPYLSTKAPPIAFQVVATAYGAWLTLSLLLSVGGRQVTRFNVTEARRRPAEAGDIARVHELDDPNARRGHDPTFYSCHPGLTVVSATYQEVTVYTIIATNVRRKPHE